ncbi:MAG: hypothetical protein IH985_01200 [Planctomycetes bacterium]|nr:hypothetical protein [Planctomycetota bacterium]
MLLLRTTPMIARVGLLGSLLVLGAAAMSPAQPGSLNEYAARAVVRIAVRDNRSVNDPGPADFEITSLLLGHAQRLHPDDPAIIRTRLDAAVTGGDQDTAIEQTRKLIVLDPSDTVAQLRLISHIINQHQTVDERIAIVERFLGPEGDAIPAEVRSRLALDAALWKRDHGDTDEFIRYLVMATSLDSTNKLAAYLAANYYAANMTDPVGQLEMLVNLLLADPLDPHTHLAIAEQLALGGAFEQALRFQRLALSLAETVSEYDTALIVEREWILSWHVEGPHKAVETLNQRLAQARDEITRHLRAAQAAGSIIADAPDPGELNLPYAHERARLVAAHAAGDDAIVAAAAFAMQAEVESVIRMVQEQETEPEQVDSARRALEADAALTQLWVGVQVAQASAEALRLADEFEQEGASPDAAHLLRAFVAIRADDPEAAVDALDHVKDKTAIYNIAMALADAAMGDRDAVRARLGAIVRENPLAPTGAWAMSQLRKEDPGASPFGGSAGTLADVAAAVPVWLDRMISRPASFMVLTIESPDVTLRALDRGGLRVRLRNISPIPLGVGPDRPINTQLLFAPSVDVDVRTRISLPILPEVVNAARRLRLAPREEMVVDVWPSMWPGATIIDLACAHTTRVRMQIIQGFVPSADVGYEPGPMCLGADAPPILRAPLAASVMGFDQLITRLKSDPELTLPGTIATLAGWMALPTTVQGRLTPEQIAQLGEAAAQRYPTLSPAGKSLLLTILPTTAQVAEFKPLELAALEETDPLAMPPVLLTRATDPDHEIFRRAVESNDTLTSRLGTLLQARLRAGGYAFSTRTPPGARGRR